MKSLWRITLMFLLVNALMNGLVQAIITSTLEEGQGGIIEQQWDHLKSSVLSLAL